ncbi:MAG: 30S ribosomal protein S6 [Verrucomicrobiales bacterium]
MSKRKYQAVIILATAGREDSLDKIIGEVGQQIESEGARLEQIDRMGKRDFAYENKDGQTAGYYVNYHFEADADAIDPLKGKLKLNNDIQLQYFKRVN